MELKKNPEVDGDKIKSSFMMIALNYVAGLSLAAFTFLSELNCKYYSIIFTSSLTEN